MLPGSIKLCCNWFAIKQSSEFCISLLHFLHFYTRQPRWGPRLRGGVVLGCYLLRSLSSGLLVTGYWKTGYWLLVTRPRKEAPHWDPKGVPRPEECDFRLSFFMLFDGNLSSKLIQYQILYYHHTN